METKYFECMCHSDEHRLVFQWNDWEDVKNDSSWFPDMYTTAYLKTFGNRFKRLKKGLQYMFGQKVKHGFFDCFLLDPYDAQRLRDMVGDYLQVLHRWERCYAYKDKQLDLFRG